jgi:hypothetical protein
MPTGDLEHGRLVRRCSEPVGDAELRRAAQGAAPVVWVHDGHLLAARRAPTRWVPPKTYVMVSVTVAEEEDRWLPSPL